MTELSTVAGAIKALSFDRETQAYEQGTRFAKNKLERLEVVTAAAQTIGADPSFDEWEAYRVQWVDGHAHQNPDLTANASDKAWKEFAKLLDELYGMTKPKSTGAAAVKKSEQREKAQEALSTQALDRIATDRYDQLQQSGVQLKTDEFVTAMDDIAKGLRQEGYTPKAFPKVAGAIEELTSTAQPKDWTELQALRKMIRSGQKSIEPEDKILVMSTKNLKMASMILAYRIKKASRSSQDA